jgi:mannosyltransferase OCH1-like enzyme
MIPRLLHFYYDSATLPFDAAERIAGFQSLNPDFEVKIWNNGNLGKIVPDLDACIRLFPTPAGASNAIRLYLLWEMGGFWFDTDFICHDSLDSLLDHEAICAYQDETRLCNAFMGAVPNHPWIEWQMEHIYDWEGWGAEWGVYNCTAAPREGLSIALWPLIYPYSYDTPKDQRRIYPDTLVEHLWKGSWISK